jgi:hypothetical protein
MISRMTLPQKCAQVDDKMGAMPEIGWQGYNWCVHSTKPPPPAAAARPPATAADTSATASTASTASTTTTPPPRHQPKYKYGLC